MSVVERVIDVAIGVYDSAVSFVSMSSVSLSSVAVLLALILLLKVRLCAPALPNFLNIVGHHLHILGLLVSEHFLLECLPLVIVFFPLS